MSGWVSWVSRTQDTQRKNFLLGSWCAVAKLHWKLRKSFQKKEAAVPFFNHVVNGEEALSNAQAKRSEMQADPCQWAKREQPALPFDGELLSSAEGWTDTRPTVLDPELHIVGMRCVKMSDGSSKNFFRVLVRPSVIAKKHRKLQEKLEKLGKRINRLEVRQYLTAIGKR